MSKCICSTNVLNNSNCPLCGRHIRQCERAENYPVYTLTNRLKARYLLQFLFIVSGAITLFIDFIVGWTGWSVYCAVSITMLWLMVFVPIFKRMGMGAVIVRTVLLLCLWAAGLEFWAGPAFDSWPSSFLMPGSIALGITMVFFFSLVKTVKWSEVGVYVVILTVFDAVLLVAGLLQWIPNLVLILIVMMYSIICLFTMSWFMRRKVMAGFKKRLRV